MRYSRAALLLLVGLIASLFSMPASAADPIDDPVLSTLARTSDADRSVGMIIESRCNAASGRDVGMIIGSRCSGENGRSVGMMIESICSSSGQGRQVGMIIESRCGARTVPVIASRPLEAFFRFLMNW